MTWKEKCKENWPWLVLFAVVITAAACLIDSFYLPLWREADRMEREQLYQHQPRTQNLQNNHDSIGFTPLPKKKD